ncbi:MAG: carboxypeptidase regulatory-like domain-containing protein [Sphingobacteriales bacterium]|nr:carboxypeptidase regulatory-like domain-containing protein [Sphingobacteriales bacterium]
MKKTVLLRFAAILPALMLIISSCSKDALPKPPEKEQTAGTQTGGKGIFNGGIIGVPGTAGLDATILPQRAMPAARLFSPDYISDEVVADENGYILFNGLQEGYYTLEVYARVPGFVSQRITNIFLLDGQITNIGTITLEADDGTDY